ncbi:TetR/AcrR family transcriptional regulator [Ilumatobacter coccineus]|uniref:Putative TetR family transcriptional regulator n=1 Tax=Ilumatobacter coccineus (strain NBRC 103263 / KCTC 29153 / YM16-304) TaxID=1313172 RepID=A0A6C7ED97_ILUCY|nr:TetR/AcrR family transcriptional regulator [Ilumatobacter coccineus]BAN04340.1 putative TetR family transcriptional regulator [Ilumatobacter coccineus YM16-304]
MQNNADTVTADERSATRRRAPGGGRKKTFDPDVVLGQALDVFWEHGYADTTTRLLEDELGLKASSIYNAFGSKGELLDAAVAQYLQRLDREILTPLRTADDPLDGLDQLIHAVSIGIDGEHRSGCLIVSLLTENAARDPALTAHTDAYMAALRSELTDTLERAVDAGLIPADTVAERIELLTTAILGINAAARGRLGPDTVEAMADSVRAQIARWRLTPAD